MRERAEIEKEIRAIAEGKSYSGYNLLYLEVLLDIRDLLNKK